MRLKTKILLTVLIIVGALNALLSYYYISSEKKTALKQLHAKIKKNESLYNSINSGPLYDVDEEKLITNLKSILADEDIVSITLREYNGDINIHFSDVISKSKQKLIKNFAIISFENEVIGELETVYTTMQIEKRLARSKKNAFFQAIIVIVILILLLFYFITKITKPIEKLVKLNSEISSGNLDVVIPTDIAGYELKNLYLSLKQMKASIKNQLIELNNKNKSLKQEIEERNTIENALRDSEAKYKAVTRNFPNGNIALFDNELYYLFIEGKGFEKAGINSKAIIGRNNDEVFEAKTASILNNHFKNALLGEEEEFKIGFGGHYYQIHSLPLLDENGNIICGMMISQDITEAKKASEEIQQNRTKLSSIINLLPSIVYIKDGEGRFLLANNACAELFNTDTVELIGKSSIDFHKYKSEAEKRIKDDKKVIETKQAMFISDEIFTKADGSRYVMQTTKVPFFDIERSEWTVLGVSTDVTQRKAIENALKESEEKFRLLSEQSLMGFIILKDNYVKYMNKACADILGFKSNEARQLKQAEIFDIVHPEDRSFAYQQALLKQKNMPGAIANYSFRIITKEKELKWIEIFSKTIAYEGGYADLITLSNITEKIKAEQQVKDSEARYRALAHNFPNGIIALFDFKLTYTFIDGLGLEDIDLRADDIIGNTNSEVFSKENALVLDKHFLDALHDKSSTFELTLGKKSYLFHCLALKNESNEILSGMLMSQDITETKKIEKLLEGRLDSLTKPVGDYSGLKLTDIILAEELQNVQDAFALVAGVNSIIVDETGTPITKQTCLSGQCEELIINAIELGQNKSQVYDSLVKIESKNKPIIESYPKGIMWRGGAQIFLGDTLVATWVICQAKTPELKLENAIKYAEEKKLGRKFIDAYNRLPVMHFDQFKQICNSLYQIATKISQMAFQNIQQARAIHQRQTAENALRESQKRLALIFDAANDGLFDWYIEKRKLVLDDRFYKMAGYEPNAFEQVFEEWVKRIHPEDYPTFNHVLQNHLNGKIDSFNCEYRFKKANGNWMWIFGKGKIVEYDMAKRPKRMVGTHTDIEARKKAEIELVELNQELEHRVETRTKDLKKTIKNLTMARKRLVQSEKMASLGALVAGVSHEINTPVGIGVSLASHLKDQSKIITEKLNSNQLMQSNLTDFLSTCDESSDLILKNLVRASELIRSFKMVAVDRTSSEKRIFNLKEYVDEILLSLRNKLKKSKHNIIVDIDENLEINSFPGAFSQVLTNLLMNTLIHAYDEEQIGTINITASSENSRLICKYYDDGKGVSNETLSKIFDPFYTSKRGQGGSGLGLNIVYNIVTTTLHGTIDCESEENNGLSFTISLPMDVNI